MLNKVTYKKYKVGKFESDKFKAVVLYLSNDSRHVRVYDDFNICVEDGKMSKQEWQAIQERYDLTMYDVQELELPVEVKY